MSARAWLCRVAVLSASIAACLNAASAPIEIHHPDHFEFDAALNVPFHADAQGAYPLNLYFNYPGAGSNTLAAWQVDVTDRQGRNVRRWIGEIGMSNQHARYLLNWDGRDGTGHALPAGFYTVRLRAVPTLHGQADFGAALFDRVHRAFAVFGSEEENQHHDVMVGNLPAPKMPAFRALPRPAQSSAGKGGAHTQSVPATGSLPYTIYLGNLHSQTNHSDGGGSVATCVGSQAPQSAALGPTDAYTMMQTQAHADFLNASEHNHMFDGSNSTNANANPATAKALFQSGVTAAANYNAAHPGFLALYGVEWGVISNGGHLNIFSPDGLPEWEMNSSGQLIGDYLTPKSDYAGIYATMKTHGWIGMFNHPATTAQFQIGGVPLAYDANGDQVMVLAEVMNSAAFSAKMDESEPQLDMYQDAFNILLERGYHVAPATDQDNHCANWGMSSTNRTGVLLPNGTPLNTANFLDALRARRVFATEDKTSQLILTANGQLMGQTINNSGALTLVANYASSSGQTAARVQFFEGVPGSNGTVTQTYEGSGSTTITPAVGSHFYYVEVTQANGKLLWSAPIWVNQTSGGGDTTPPTTSAAESGSSGTITLSATASDNVGVTRVEFYVDGVLKGTDTTSPYGMTLNSTTLANGSHTVATKAYDAAGNIGTSSAVSFSVSNGSGGDTTPPTLSASESGSSGTITLSSTATDNIGVTKVEFFVDNLLKGTDTTSPYSMALDSTTLANGSHTLIAKGYDAAGNVGTSAGAGFTVSNSVTGGELIGNGGFESGASVWTESSGVIDNSGGEPTHGGWWNAWLDGYGSAHTDTLSQTVTIPTSATTATLSFWLLVDSTETSTTKAYDTLTLQVRSSSNAVLSTLHTYSNLDKGSAYTQRSFDLSAYKGQTVKVYFSGVEDKQDATSFVIDDVSLKTQ